MIQIDFNNVFYLVGEPDYTEIFEGFTISCANCAGANCLITIVIDKEGPTLIKCSRCGVEVQVKDTIWRK